MRESLGALLCSLAALAVASCASPGGMTAPPPPPPPPPPMAPPPPPPPPPPAYMADGSGEVAVTGSRMPSPTTPSPSPTSPVPPNPQPRPQAGILTAGDYDDLLNPGMYADYTGRYLQDRRGQFRPYLDTARAITIRVTGRGGRPLPFAWVDMQRENGRTLTLSTGADGEAVIFPGFDDLPDTIDITVRDPSGQARASTIAVSEAQLPRDRVVPVSLNVAAERPRQLDLALVIDTTGSMGDELRYIQTELGSILNWVEQSLPGVDVRVGLIAYRDEGDEYVVRGTPLTDDIQHLQAMLARESASGGGDYPEAMQDALRRMYDMDWRQDAVRVGLLIADAPPHEEDFSDAWGAAVLAREGRIHITPVAASGVGDDAEYLMRAMAALTQSRYLFLTDDSGVGLPHDTPEVKCYQVTRLDSLIRRVIAGYMTGERVEASPQEVIRTVGVYDQGVCRRG